MVVCKWEEMEVVDGVWELLEKMDEALELRKDFRLSFFLLPWSGSQIKALCSVSKVRVPWGAEWAFPRSRSTETVVEEVRSALRSNGS